MPEDSPHGRFATEDSPHNECDREFERKRRTNVCNSHDVEDLPHNGDRLGSGGRGWGVGSGGLGRPQPPYPPDFNPPYPNPLDPTPPSTPTYHRCVVNLPHRHCCKRLSDAYAQILGHIRKSHLLSGNASPWRIFCGESSMWRILWQPIYTGTKAKNVRVQQSSKYKSRITDTSRNCRYQYLNISYHSKQNPKNICFYTF